MEVHSTSWPSLERGSLTASGDVGVTEPQDQPRHASQSLDQQAADILKLFGDSTQDCTSTSNMDFDAFPFDDPLPVQFGAMEHDNTSHSDPVSSASDSSNSSSNCDSSLVQTSYGTWPMVSGPPTFGYEQTALPAGPMWVADPRFGQHMSFDNHGGDRLGIHMPPTSDALVNASISAYDRGHAERSGPLQARDEYGRQHFAGPWQRVERSAPPPEDIFGDDADEDGVDSTDPCYAQLLYKCLREAPHHTLSLRELYDWVSQHSQKAKDPGNRGWQNSVRHNLSMNAAFQRVTDRSNSSKKGSLWRLTDQALRDGVISTTRYRKDPKRKPERRAIPALNRQASGAKGGRATRDASRMRQQHQRLHGTHTSRHLRRADRHHHMASPQYSPYSTQSTPHSPHIPFIPYPAHTIPMSAPTSQPASPYFNIHRPEDDELTTPMGFHLPGYHQATPEDFPPAAKPPSVSSFEFMPLDVSQGGLFGDHDPELGTTHPDTPTPSLMTEASFMTDDQQMVSCRSSREGTML
ncbi:putative Fork head domain, winged helix-like DNA-binding domain superfamily [Septoria linicola]|nr:putative Fork head domain, winged helix-like DNA-binding domain superfamily [Septoria linicola]